MCFLVSTFTFETGGRGNFSGQLNWVNPGFTELRRLYFPPHASAIERHPSVFTYAGRQYLLGHHTRNILVDEDLRVLRMGMLPPPQAPSLSVGGGAVPMIGYLRLYDEITGERSSTGAGTTVTGDVPRTWSTLPTSVVSEEIVLEGTVTVAAGVVTGVNTRFGLLRPGDRVADATVLTRWAQVRSIASDTSMIIDDTGMAIGAGGTLSVKPVSRASHIEGWVSVDGALPRRAWQARLGTTSIVESVASLALGEALIEEYEPMPTCGFGTLYNDRTIVAGVPGHEDTVYLSLIGYPERHGGLAFRTDYGEPVVGMFQHGGAVIVLTSTPDGEGSYRLSGYTDNDYEMRVLEAKSGGIGHHGNREIPGGVVLVPSSKGMQLFNSAFHPGIPTRLSEWNRDVRDNVAAFEGGFGAVNPNDGTYRFVPYSNRIEISSDEEESVGPIDASLFFSTTAGVDLSRIDDTDTVAVRVAFANIIGGRIALHNRRIYWAQAYGATQTQFQRVAVDDTVAENQFVIPTLDFGNDEGCFIGGSANGKLWVVYGYGYSGSPTNGRIYSYSGGVVTLENSFAYADTASELKFAADGMQFNFIPFLGGWIGYPHASSFVRRFIYRNAAGVLSYPRFVGAGADDTGTWAIPGDGPRTGRPALFNDKIYFPNVSSSTSWLGTGSYHAEIQSFDGTTVALAHTLPELGGGASAGQAWACCTHGGLLYYLWINKQDVGWSLVLGRYDGVTWDDNYLTIGASILPTDLVSHNGFLYVTAFTPGGPVQGIWKSNAGVSAFTHVYATATVITNGIGLTS